MDQPEMDNPVIRRGFWILAVVAFGLATFLIWQPQYLPLVDWPNHMARHRLEARWLSGEELPPFYKIEYRIVPNLGTDLFVPPLLLVFDDDTVSRLVVILSIVLFWLVPTLY